MSVQEMIYSQMNHFFDKSTDQNGEVSYDTVIEIACWTAAYMIRQRHLQTQDVSQDEMQLVLGTIGNSCKENFGDDFTQEDFEVISKRTLELFQSPSFDTDARDFFGKFY